MNDEMNEVAAVKMKKMPVHPGYFLSTCKNSEIFSLLIVVCHVLFLLRVHLTQIIHICDVYSLKIVFSLDRKMYTDLLHLIGFKG